MKQSCLFFIKFYLLVAAFLMLAGCGEDEIVPNAAIRFYPEADDVVMSPGEPIELRVSLGPLGKLKELHIDKTVSGAKQPFLTLAAPDTSVVFTDQVELAAQDSSRIIYTFKATTTDDKITYRTFTVLVKEFKLHEGVKLGAQANNSSGHFYAVRPNTVYSNPDTAKEYSGTIDFVYYNRSGFATDSLSTYEATISAPSSGRARLVYPEDSVNLAGLPSWSTRNATKFKRAEPSHFDLPGIFALTSAYNTIETEADQITKLSATTNNTFFYKTADERIGIVRVREVSNSPSAEAGYIIFDIRSLK